MLKVLLTLTISAAAIATADAAAHAAALTACDATCDAAFTKTDCEGVCKATLDSAYGVCDAAFTKTDCEGDCKAQFDIDSDQGAKDTCDAACVVRSRRAGHNVIRDDCKAAADTTKGTCDDACVVRSRRAGHNVVRDSCKASCTFDFDVAAAGGAIPACNELCDTNFDFSDKAQCSVDCAADQLECQGKLAEPTTDVAGMTACATKHGAKAAKCLQDCPTRSRRAGHSAVRATCKATCATPLAVLTQNGCNADCEADFQVADSARSRRAGHADIRTACQATCQTGYDDATAEKKEEDKEEEKDSAAIVTASFAAVAAAAVAAAVL